MRIPACAFVIAAASVALLAIAVLSAGAEAGRRDIMADWTLPAGTTAITGDTIDVRGSVTVPAGATLRLYNCTLRINWTADGGKGLSVAAGGRLEAYDTTIEGLNARAAVVLGDDTVIERCTIRHFHGTYTGTNGIQLAGGDITVRDTIISDGGYYGLVVMTDAVIDNVTARELDYAAVYVENWHASSAYTFMVTDCGFTGRGGGDYKYGIYFSTYTGYPKATGLVRGTVVQNYQVGLRLYYSSSLNLTVEGCSFVNNVVGAQVDLYGGTVILRDNVFGHRSGSTSVGLSLSGSSGQGVSMEGNVFENVGRGVVFNAPWSGSRDVRWGDLYVANCTDGIVSKTSYSYGINLVVHNSTVRNCTYAFCAEGEGDAVATLTVWDTEHAKGSGRIVGDKCWIKAYWPVTISSVRWKGGDPIMSGFLVLENVTRYEVARFNISDLRSQSVVGWEISSAGRVYSRDIWPAMYLSGYSFRGDKLDIWGGAPARVELVDDFLPEVTAALPLEDSFHNVTTLLASGEYRELGSGIAGMQWSLDGADFADLTSFHDGAWTLPLIGLADGAHALQVRARDAVGNVGNVSARSFTVDTVRPFIELQMVPALVNTTNVTVQGRVEPGALLTIDGRGYGVDGDGRFEAEVALREGPNAVHFLVVDPALNYNSTAIAVVRDTIAPMLKVTAPDDGVWTKEDHVYVEGLTEPGVALRINGVEAAEVAGSFRERLALVEGTFDILVEAADAAGNRVERSLRLLVDLTTPAIIIVQPEALDSITKERELFITGDVDDPTIDHVTINGVVVTLTTGRFVKSYSLAEGPNSYNVSVVDQAGNADSTVIRVVRDLTAPTYEVELLSVGGSLVKVGNQVYSTATAVDVHVLVDETSVVKVAGRDPVTFSMDTKLRFVLQEGVNDISFSLVDLAGNEALSYSARVIVDTTRPPITMFEPTAGLRTKEPSVVLHGRTDANCNVTVRGSPVTLLPGGEFRLVVALEDGANDIAIRCVDPMGNSNETTVSVYKEGEVKAQEQTGVSVAVAVAGFVAGIVIGLVAALAMMAARRGKPAPEERAPVGPRPEHAGKAPPPGPTEDGKAPPRGKGGWEEY